jgi:hypothetical protein
VSATRASRNLLLEDLRTPAREVRKLDPAHVREVANSIGTLGFCAPIAFRRRGFSASVRLALWVEQLGETDQRVLRLAMNRLSAKGEWNVDELKIESKELILADGPIEISGFTLDEIDQISSAKRTTPLSRVFSRPKPARSPSPA